MATRIEELKEALADAHGYLHELERNPDADPFEIAGAREDVRMAVRELENATIDRPFSNYENEYGDYPI